MFHSTLCTCKYMYMQVKNIQPIRTCSFIIWYYTHIAFLALIHTEQGMSTTVLAPIFSTNSPTKIPVLYQTELLRYTDLQGEYKSPFRLLSVTSDPIISES